MWRIFDTAEKDQTDLITGEVSAQSNELTFQENSIHNTDDSVMKDEYKNSLIEPEFPVQEETDKNLNPAKENADLLDLKNDESVKFNIKDNKTDL